MSDTNGTSTTRIQMRNKKNLETHLNGTKDISKYTIGFFLRNTANILNWLSS